MSQSVVCEQRRTTDQFHLLSIQNGGGGNTSYKKKVSHIMKRQAASQTLTRAGILLSAATYFDFFLVQHPDALSLSTSLCFYNIAYQVSLLCVYNVFLPTDIRQII